MTLEQLKEQYLLGELSVLKVQWRLKNYKEELDLLYPQKGPLAAKFHFFAHGGDRNIALCDTSMKFRTFHGLGKGFRKFCGNQGDCNCNRDYIQSVYNSRSADDNKKIVQKRKQTNRKKYGSDFASQTDAVKEKSAQTCIKKYGVKAATMNPTIVDKSKTTCFENWGVEYPQQNQEIFDRTRKIFENLYGCNTPSKNTDIANKMSYERRKSGYDRFLNLEYITPLFDCDFYAKSKNDDVFLWKCNKCNEEFTHDVDNRKTPRCYSCDPKKETWGETLIKNFLLKNNITFTQWERTVISPKELDFWIPAHNLAIEFNGNWWHREDNVSGRNHHQLKWKACDELDIKLIQVWEHELIANPTIVFGRLLHAIGGNVTKIAARKCTIKKLTVTESREFFNNNHLQGDRSTSYAYGLLYNGIVVAAASFGKSRYDKKIKWELLRYATLNGSNVQGGLGKLLSFAQKDINFDSLVTYANLNWGKGEIYEKLGFVFQNISGPNYYYTKGDLKIHSRLKFQKHKIIGKAVGNSEKEIAQNMGYFRFFDAGNAVWIKYY
jgi:hypothetical protein